jgi:hypothetical protein
LFFLAWREILILIIMIIAIIIFNAPYSQGTKYFKLNINSLVNNGNRSISSSLQTTLTPVELVIFHLVTYAFLWYSNCYMSGCCYFPYFIEKETKREK